MNERHESDERELTDQPAITEATGADEVRTLRADDRRRRRRALIAGGLGLAVLIGVTAGGVATAGRTEAASSASAGAATIVYPGGSRGSFGGGYVIVPSWGGSTQGGSTQGGSSASEPATGATDAVAASTAQTAGVVTITSELTYQGARSAGTGMILTSDGMILTNNHVVEGATAISVTVESTGRSYTARVVGTDATNDVAVLQLEDASGLTPPRSTRTGSLWATP